MSIYHPLRFIADTLTPFCTDQHITAWLVGGAARDLALGDIPHDLDIAVDTDGVALARKLADATGGAFVALDDERGTGRVVYAAGNVPASEAASLTIDLAQLRAPALEDDLRLRDFTVNALALPLTAFPPHFTGDQEPVFAPADYIDPCGGLPDIAARVLRLCGPASLRDDPLRVLRALRLGAAPGFAIAPELDEALRSHASLVVNVAAERVHDELLKLLSAPQAAPWLRYMDDIGLLTHIFPELEPARTCEQPIVHFLPVLAHSLEAVACLEWLLVPLLSQQQATPGREPPLPPGVQSPTPAAVQTHPDLPRTLPYSTQFQVHFDELLSNGHARPAYLKLATLLHDNAKPQTKQPKDDGGVSFYGHQSQGAETVAAIARRLRLGRQSGQYVALVVREHMRPGQLRGDASVTPRAVVRFFRDTGEAGPDVLLHSMADHIATRGPWIDLQDWQHHIAWTGTMLDAHWGAPPERTRPLLNGHDLMTALGIEPGKRVGELLREIQEAQAAGEISSREEALALARRLLTDHYIA
jgi:poly(A) polymerase/tRNA nucleotidyltransferase (CCA-adding enzyme)